MTVHVVSLNLSASPQCFAETKREADSSTVTNCKHGWRQQAQLGAGERPQGWDGGAGQGKDQQGDGGGDQGLQVLCQEESRPGPHS